MKLTGLHLLLTYQCNFECEHCFLWGSPRQKGVMTLAQIRDIVCQGTELGTVEWIYLEGGEPFLYYPVMLRGAQIAGEAGFKVGLVSNSYWATSLEDALEWLRPFAGWLSDLAVSTDLYHYDEKLSRQVRHACAAAEKLGIPAGVLQVAEPGAVSAAQSEGQLPVGESTVMYRGRAAEKLACRAGTRPWTEFTQCPHEDLREPGRVHVDPYGYMHICQGLSVGNLFQQRLQNLCAAYDPQRHPITGPLLDGGPAELVRRYGLTHEPGYADACHLCYEARKALRSRFPDLLTPDMMYGVEDS
jgi:hypothetical protein